MKKWYSLMDKIYRMDNLEKSFKSVKANDGAPGIDGQSSKDYGLTLSENLTILHEELKSGTYVPSPVLRVEIDKPDGGKRKLGIPTVKDRIAQQALLNLLQPIFDPDFHPSSYGYRPGKSCHKALAKAERFINRYGYEYVVDMDLSKCFDRLNHELIIKSVAKKVSDGKVLKLIRKFLESGVMVDGAVEETSEGSPQGGVISPLLANIYLDYFDQKMKSENIRIVRYADDILIFGKTIQEANENRQLATRILETELKLVINNEKTRVLKVSEGIPYLGFIIFRTCVIINPKKIAKAKEKIRKLTPRNSGINLEKMLEKLNIFIRGWFNYFRVANCKGLLEEIMGWIRRRLRMKKMKEWKSWKPLHRRLRQLGKKGVFEKISMSRWNNAASPLINIALGNKWFDEMGLYDMSDKETGILSRFREA